MLIILEHFKQTLAYIKKQNKNSVGIQYKHTIPQLTCEVQHFYVTLNSRLYDISWEFPTDMWSATLLCYIKLSTLWYKLRVFYFIYFLDTIDKLFYNQTFFLGCYLFFIQGFLFYFHLINWSQFPFYIIF